MGSYYRLSELGYTLPAGAHVLPRETFEPLAAATGLLQAAEVRAAEIVADAEAAYRTKCEEGYAAGLERARAEALNRLLNETAALDHGLRQCEADLARLVGACVRKLVADFDDAARAESVVRGALKHMRREKRAELHVSPSQYRHFKARIEDIAREFPEMELIDVIEDPALTSPQIILESRIGRVEADVSGRMADFEEMVRDVAARFAETAA